MKKLSSFICAALLCASTLPALAASSEDNNQQPPQGKRHAPPPEAVEACKGLTENTTCQFNGRNNELVSGVCGTPPNNASSNTSETAVLACHPKRGSRDEHPPKDDATN